MEKKCVLPSPKFLDNPLKSQISIKSPSPPPKCILMPGLVSTNFSRQSSFKKDENEFRRPPPILNKNDTKENMTAVHFSSPKGMLMPSYMQPPPMYGPRGPTIPPKYLNQKSSQQNSRKIWCETCDKDFSSHAELQSHKSEHKTCGIEGCSFTGDSSIIANHIEHTHTSGLYKKIKKLSTPEEIAKWRDERRKRYPTRANVELRQKAQEERMKRGEKLGQRKSRFGNKHERRPIRNNIQPDQRIVLRKPSNFNSQNTRKRENPPQKRKELETVSKRPEEVFEQEFKGNLPRFKGTSTLEGYIKAKPKTIESNPLAKHLGMYGSDEESSNDEEIDEPENESDTNSPTENDHNIATIVSTENDRRLSDDLVTSEVSSESNFREECNVDHTKQNTETEESLKDDDIKVSQQSNSSKSIDSDDDMPEEAPIERQPLDPLIQQIVHDDKLESNGKVGKCEHLHKVTEKLDESLKVTAPENKRSDSHRKRFRRKRGTTTRADQVDPEQKKAKNGLLDYSKLRTRRQNTMLEKLLERDIIHERNVILQCIRFVVENDFFGIGS